MLTLLVSGEETKKLGAKEKTPPPPTPQKTTTKNKQTQAALNVF